MIQIRRIEMSDPLYPQELALRESALLRPVGLDLAAFGREFPGFEERFEHFVAVFDHPAGERIVGCALLLAPFPAPGVGKLMQMVVDPQRQGEGIGKRLVVAIERRAFGELGLTELFCHAQLAAVGFYQQLEWEVEGPTFDEAGIPHKRMRFRAPTESAD